MVCILSDVNKIDPNLTFRSSRTPSVCQYKHQSLVCFVYLYPQPRMRNDHEDVPNVYVQPFIKTIVKW